MSDSKHDQPETDQSAAIDGARREALAKMGRLAGYTAPAMLALLGAKKARATAVPSVPKRK